MELIVAVYEDWGIGSEGTQPIALKADRRFFREMTRGATVIVGRRTVEDFPEQKPLPNRVNVVLTRSAAALPGFQVCADVASALALVKDSERVMVIGGGSIYRQLLPYCHTAYVTKVHCTPQSDTFFPNLDEAPDWRLESTLQSGTEEGIDYEMCRYVRKGSVAEK